MDDLTSAGRPLADFHPHPDPLPSRERGDDHPHPDPLPSREREFLKGDPLEHEIETDVLVIGGGTAGCVAAMAARELEKSVTVLEKGGSIRRSGSLASGVDHYSAILGEGAWDTPEAYVRAGSSKPGLTDMTVLATHARNSKKVFDYLEGIGVPFKDAKTGRYFRIAGMGGRNPSTICFEGGPIKTIFDRHMRKLGVNILERVATGGLLTRNGRVTGAVGFHIRTGDFYVVKAKSVVIATGGAARLFPSPTGRTFFSHAPPFNTGDGHVMAFRAGAALANMEFTYCSVSPKGTDSPALTGLIGLGGFFINALGQQFMESYHPLGNHAPRNVVINAFLKEFAAGRGPVYVDCRHLAAEAIERIKKGIMNERPTLLDFLRQKDIDIGRDPIPFELREMETQGQGIKIDEECRSSLEGLYAAGDCSNISLAVSGACTLGYVAGQRAAACAATVPGHEAVARQIAALRRTIYQPLHNQGHIRPGDLEDELRRIMIKDVGFTRSDSSLRSALAALNELKNSSRAMVAWSGHELMRASETRNLIDVASLVATAALERKESRSLPAHFRADYPQQDDARWRGFVVLNGAANGEIEAKFQPL